MRRWRWVVILLVVAATAGILHSHHRHEHSADPIPAGPTASTTETPLVPGSAPTSAPIPTVPSSPTTPRASASGTISATVWRNAAEQFTQDYARPAVDHQTQWATGVRRWLAPSAQVMFDNTNPAAVPFARVTGPAVLQDAGVPSDVLALAQVPTDHGTWWVAMVYRSTGVQMPGGPPGGVQVVWYGSDPAAMPQ